MPATPRIFVSYRRDDSIVHATLLHDRLAEHFGAENVFMDKEDIVPGDDFARVIDERIAGYDVLLAVIGPRWAELLAARPAGAPDYVRREIGAAFERGMRVIPLLVGGATPAQFAAVPADLERLRTTDALAVKDAELREDIVGLIEALQGKRFDEMASGLERERRRSRFGRVAGVAIGLAAFFAAWVALLDVFALDTRFSGLTLWLGGLGGRPAATGQVMVVTIDPETVKRVGRPFDRSWRHEHATLVDRLSQAGARTIAFDLFFREPEPQLDEELAGAIFRARMRGVAVIVGVDAIDGARPDLAPRLARVLGAWGIACAGEKLGLARSMPLAARRGEATIPSLALATFGGGAPVEAFDVKDAELRMKSFASEKLADIGFSAVQRVRVEHAGCPAIRAGDTVALQFLPPPPAGFWLDPTRRLAYEEVLAAESAAARVRGKHVLIGLALPGEDTLRVGGAPRASERFGVELHAAQLDAILRGEVIRPLGPIGQLAVMLALGLTGAYARHALGGLKPVLRWGLLGAALAAYLALVALLLGSERILMNLPYEIGAFAAAYWAMGRLDRRSAR